MDLLCNLQLFQLLAQVENVVVLLLTLVVNFVFFGTFGRMELFSIFSDWISIDFRKLTLSRVRSKATKLKVFTTNLAAYQ